jgi:outer membrane receptor protein involved in Fe transport
VAPDYRWGVRVSGGYQESQTWDRSRTALGDAQREYEAAGFSSDAVHAPAPGYDLRPLEGQVKAGAFGLPGVASGSADPVQTWYANARADWYPADGSVLTAEGGLSRVHNTVIATPGGRSQVTRADRPWARVAWNTEAFSVFGYYTGRDGEQYSLGTGTRAVDEAATLHVEGQFNRNFAGTRGRLVAGASARRQTVDSRGTILGAADDGRADQFYALFQQLDFEIAEGVKLIAASRLDEGTLHGAIFSPKLGLMVTPRKDQTVRVTWNRGFLTPSSFQRFLWFPAAAPLDLRALEGGLRLSPLGPALAGVPSGTLFDASAAVPVLALGNRELKPEDVTGMEVGYKGQLGRVFLTVDAYYSRIRDFSTGVLAGVNGAFAPWTAPSAVPEAVSAGLEAAVIGTLGPGFTRLPGTGTSAYVLSFGNAGKAREYGVEVGLGVQVNSRLRLDANYAGYRFSLDQETFHPSDTVEANTPPHSANVAAIYEPGNGVRARVGVRWEDGFTFRSGTWVGDLPSSRSVDVNLTYPLGHRLTATLTGTNVLDEQRVHLMGGSLIGRRVLLTLGWSH